VRLLDPKWRAIQYTCTVLCFIPLILIQLVCPENIVTVGQAGSVASMAALGDVQLRR
jgi:hypothetical protein